MRWLLLLILPSAALGANTLSFLAQLQAEQQARLIFGVAGAPPTATSELFPMLGATANLTDATFGLTYNPQIFATFGAGDDRPQVMHNLRLGGELRSPSKDVRFALVDMGSFGKLDFLTLATAQPATPNGPQPALQRVPTFKPIPFANNSTEATFDWAYTHRLKGTLDAIYSFGGGLGSGQALVPWQHRLQGSYTLADTVTREDTLSTVALASRTSFVTGQQTQVGQLTQLWKTQADRQTTLELGAGGAVIETYQGLAQGDVLQIVPAAQASLLTKPKWKGAKVELSAMASLGPFVDWLSATAYERGDAAVGVRWEDVTSSWILSTRLRGALPVNAGPLNGQAIAVLEFTATYAITKDLRLDGGTQLLWQRVPQPGSHSYGEWATFISLTLVERGSL